MNRISAIQFTKARWKMVEFSVSVLLNYGVFSNFNLKELQKQAAFQSVCS